MFTAFGLLFVAIGVALVIRGYSARAQAACSLRWLSVEGLVLSSAVEGKEFQEDDSLRTVRRFRPAVTYSFRAGGVARQGTEIAIGMSNLYGEQHVAELRAGGYPVGAKVRVYYDPASGASVLEPGNQASANTIIGIGLGFAVTGIAVLLLGLRLSHVGA